MIIFNAFSKTLFIFSYRRIYPEKNEEEYEAFFTNSCSLFQETAASKARIECARLLREEIKTKSLYIENMRRKNGIADNGKCQFFAILLRDEWYKKNLSLFAFPISLKLGRD